MVLSGASNDADVLQTSLCFAAREKCDLKVVLAATFPKGTFLKQLDQAMWQVTKLGLQPPQVAVERRRDQRKPQPADSTA